MRKPLCALSIVMLILSMGVAYVGTEPQLPKLFVYPPTYTASLLGEVFTVDINIDNVQSLIEFEFKLGYNTTLLDALDAVAGPLVYPPFLEQTEINETGGYVWIHVMCWPATGNGTLATVTFKSTKAEPASCTLDLYDTEFQDVNTDPVYPDVEDGSYEFMISPLTVATDKPYYLPGETVGIQGNLTLELGGSPYQGLTTVEVDDPRNNPLVVRTLQTNLTISPKEISILGVVPCDMWGNPKTSFRRGATQIDDLFYVKVIVKNNDPTERKNVVITANIYDINEFSVGVGAVGGQLYPGPPESHVIPISIPEWASVGDATVFANAFTTWPGCGFAGDRPLKGVPYCPEENASFQITDGGGGATALEAQSSDNNSTAGNYSLTFNLPPDAKTGIYQVYAVSLYQGRSAAGSAVFGVNAIYVPDHHLTIQGAVDAATSTNNSILVLSATYNEHVTITESLKLVGIDPINTIISGSGTGTVVTAAADEVEISRFTIQNSGGSFSDSGITLNNSSNSIVSENTILNNYHGIYLANSSQHNIIRDNTMISGNIYGIKVNSSNNEILQNMVANNNYGIYLNYSASTSLKRNNMICNKYNFGIFGDSLSDFIHTIDTSNTVEGKPIIYWVNKQSSQIPSNAGYIAVVNSTDIVVRSLNLTKNGQGVLFAYTAYSTIERVNAADNWYGVYLIGSYNNTIVGCAVTNNSVGIHKSYSNENIVCHNNFVNNTNQVDLYQSSNTWDDDAGRGNYWSDYAGADDGSGNRTVGDGVGDTLLPHQGVDWYPLMNPWTLVHDMAVTSVTYVTPHNVSYAYPGWKIDITVIAKNEGDYTENVSITTYYDGNTIDTKNVTLLPLADTTLVFTWNAEVPPSNCTISANATLPPPIIDNDPADNARNDGIVQVLRLADVNGDGKVSGSDIVLVLINLGPIPPSPPKCDINGDGAASGADLVLTLINLG